MIRRALALGLLLLMLAAPPAAATTSTESLRRDIQVARSYWAHRAGSTPACVGVRWGDDPFPGSTYGGCSIVIDRAKAEALTDQYKHGTPAEYVCHIVVHEWGHTVLRSATHSSDPHDVMSVPGTWDGVPVKPCREQTAKLARKHLAWRAEKVYGSMNTAVNR